MCIRDSTEYDEVIAMAADVGQGEELEPLHEKAAKTGAAKLYIEDLREEFITDYVYPTLKAGAVYERKYLLGTSMARPIIAKRLVEIAKKEGADAIAHGCTGKGNDQVRFELTVKALAPELKVVAPWRIWDIKSREQEDMCIRDRPGAPRWPFRPVPWRRWRSGGSAESYGAGPSACAAGCGCRNTHRCARESGSPAH